MPVLRRQQSRLTTSKIAAAVLGVGCVAAAGVYLWPDRAKPDVAQDAAPVAQTAPEAKPTPAFASLSQPIVTSTPTPSTAGNNASPPSLLAAPATRPAVLAAAPVPAAAPQAGFLDAAKRLQDAGKLLDARRTLNDALQTGGLDRPTAEAVKARIRDLNQTILFTPTKRYADDPQQSAYTVQSGDLLTKICSKLDVPYGFIARINAVAPDKIRVGQNLKLVQGPIHAVVDKNHFTIDLYLGALPGKPGSMYLETFRVGLGESSSTPTGLWEVASGSKTVNPAWTNPRTNEVFGRDDPKNPLGERWIGLTGIAGDAVGAVSYGIHGTIAPESIGTNASMGCIRLKDEDIADLFDMLSEGKSTVLVVAD